MRTGLIAFLVLLGACSVLSQSEIQTSVEERLHIDVASGKTVLLRNDGPGELLFELYRDKGPPNVIKVAAGLSWSMSLEGVRSIEVVHKSEGAGHVTVALRGGGSLHVQDSPAN